jgi:seryl-tRNA synthetase
MQEINKITNQLESTQSRMKRARELYLDNELEKEEYQEMTTELEVERQNLTTRLNHLQKDDKEFSKNISTIFEIVSKSYEIFKSSELDEKRRIINILFPNLEMNQEKLVFTIRKPLDAMLNLGESPLWLPTIDKFRTDKVMIVQTMRRVLPFEEEMLLAV